MKVTINRSLNGLAILIILILNSCGTDNNSSIRTRTRSNDLGNYQNGNNGSVVFSSTDTIQNWNNLKVNTQCANGAIRIADRTYALPNNSKQGNLTQSNMPSNNVISKSYVGVSAYIGDLILLTQVQNGNGSSFFMTISFCTYSKTLSYGNKLTIIGDSVDLRNGSAAFVATTDSITTTCPFGKIGNADVYFTAFGQSLPSNGVEVPTKFVPVNGCQ